MQPSKKMIIFEEDNEEMKSQGNSQEFMPLALSKDQISHIFNFYHQKSSQEVEAFKEFLPCKRIRKKQGKKGKRVPSQSQKPRGRDAKLRKEVAKETVYKRKMLNTMPILTQFETVLNYNFEDGVVMRQAQDEKVTLNQQQNNQNTFHLSIAHFKAIQLYDQQLISRLIEYVSNLAQKSKLSGIAKKALSEKSISHYFSQLLGGEFKTSFAKHSTPMLNDRLLQIVKQFKAEERETSSSLRIQIEILAYFLKIYYQIYEYIPPKETNYGHMEGPLRAVIKLLSIDLEQLRELKRIFVENLQKIEYFKQIREISHLGNAYYLIALKQRIVAKQFCGISITSLDDTIKELMDHKAQVILQHKNTITNCVKLSLSELYEKRKRKKEVQPASVEKFIRTMEIYEQLIEKYGVQINQRKLEQIKVHYGKDFQRYLFRIYVEKKMRIHQYFKDNIDGFKNALITQQLMNNPQCSYMEAVKNIYREASVYIKQDYFNDNLVSVLLKEVQYQQLKYIIRWFKVINRCNSQNISVIFLDSVSLKEKEGQESEQQENVSPSVSVAVTLKGALLCKACIKPMSQIELLKQYLKMFEEIRSSIILLFDDQFPLPMELEKREELFYLRKNHTVLILPRISLLPNPCKGIVDCLKSALPQYLSRGEEFQEAIQNAIQEFDEDQVKEIVDREWEKVEKFVSTLRDGQREEQPNRMNAKDEGQNMVEEFERFGRNKKEQRLKYISQQYFEEIIEQKNSEEPLIQPQSPEEPQRQQAKASNQVTSLPIMENLQSRSVDDLRTALAHLLSRNNKNPLFSNRHTAYNPNTKQIEIVFQDLGISNF